MFQISWDSHLSLYLFIICSIVVATKINFLLFLIECLHMHNVSLFFMQPTFFLYIFCNFQWISILCEFNSKNRLVFLFAHLPYSWVIRLIELNSTETVYLSQSHALTIQFKSRFFLYIYVDVKEKKIVAQLTRANNFVDSNQYFLLIHK